MDPSLRFRTSLRGLRGARGHTSPLWSGAFAHAEETRFARAHERREARLDGHAFVFARDCRAACRTPCCCSDGPSTSRAARPGPANCLCIEQGSWCVRVPLLGVGCLLLHARFYPSSPRTAARDTCARDDRALTLALRLSARAALCQASDKDPLRLPGAFGHRARARISRARCHHLNTLARVRVTFARDAQLVILSDDNRLSPRSQVEYRVVGTLHP